MKFVFEGTAKKTGKGRKFSVEVEAASEKAARELLYSRLGSNNGVRRNQVEISSCRKEN